MLNRGSGVKIYITGTPSAVSALWNAVATVAATRYGGEATIDPERSTDKCARGEIVFPSYKKKNSFFSGKRDYLNPFNIGQLRAVGARFEALNVK